MELAILIGIQGAGKTTFYMRRMADTHVRVNLDTLRTREKEARIFRECIANKQDLAVDNTNVLAYDRARYIPAAREAGYRVKGYYFAVPLEEAIARNSLREGRARVPDAVIRQTREKLQLPDAGEGFDDLYQVAVTDGEFAVTTY